jgi:hypothetical protein
MDGTATGKYRQNTGQFIRVLSIPVNINRFSYVRCVRFIYSVRRYVYAIRMVYYYKTRMVIYYYKITSTNTF